jgi:hypothetical protein
MIARRVAVLDDGFVMSDIAQIPCAWHRLMCNRLKATKIVAAVLSPVGRDL